MMLLGFSLLFRKNMTFCKHLHSYLFQHITENYYSNSKYLSDMDKICQHTNTFRKKQVFVKR